MKKTALTLLLAAGLTSLAQAQAPYQLPDLPYAYNALEPYIDAQTMEIHHSKHHAAYVNNLNKAVEGKAAAKATLHELLAGTKKYGDAVRNNAGGHYNHSLFWTVLTPEKNTQPSAALARAITAAFTSLDSLKSLLNSAASTRFGSGWAWLYVTPAGKLAVSSTPNQDNPLMDVAEHKGIPILGIDVWEHAYYLKYQNKRGDYLAAIWQVINWNEVSRRYQEAMAAKK